MTCKQVTIPLILGPVKSNILRWGRIRPQIFISGLPNSIRFCTNFSWNIKHQQTAAETSVLLQVGPSQQQVHQILLRDGPFSLTEQFSRRVTSGICSKTTKSLVMLFLSTYFSHFVWHLPKKYRMKTQKTQQVLISQQTSSCYFLETKSKTVTFHRLPGKYRAPCRAAPAASPLWPARGPNEGLWEERSPPKWANVK